MSSPTVLIADDHKHMLKLLRMSLEPTGCRIITADCGEEVLVKAAAIPVDLLLIDFEMTGLTGVETARQLRDIPQYANLPIILITGRGQSRICADATQAGVSVVMTKPFSPMELVETVQRLLSKRTGSAEAPAAEPESA
jgi:two-component system phosphate regulon response regulator PhoB